MKATIKLFKAVPIKSKRKKAVVKDILKETVKRGFIFSPEVIYNYTDKELRELIKVIEEEIGLTPEKMNASFHKSWKKVKEAPIIQLVLEQLLHYITTYGFEELGIYDENSVYIPSEKLEMPELDTIKIKLTVIRGYTKDELKEKLMKLLSSGIALKDETIKDVIEVTKLVEVNENDISKIRNREVKIMMYDELGETPENPVEFLRYVVYKTTEKTLLIKNDAMIEEIKSGVDGVIEDLFWDYKREYGLNRLAEIFYRFKPLFLAFKGWTGLKPIINRIRKLAKDYHEPLKEDYLNTITAKIKNREKISMDELEKELNKVNVFRKIRLAYALKFRTTDSESIMYKIRNGKAYSTSFNFDNKTVARKTLNIVLDSIVKDIKKKVKGKKIYIPENMIYTLPATEKQFTGNIPSGSYVSIPKDMIVGVHWNNTDTRIDLDLSMINIDGKIGWDSAYRNEEKSILFSGDITDAPKPNGASELFYVKRQVMSTQLLMLNYYNFHEDSEVPFKIIVAREQAKNFKDNYMVNPNNMELIVKSNINKKQKVLGLLITTMDKCRFYFTESYLGKSITSSSDKDYIRDSKEYLVNFYKNAITFNDVLVMAGAEIVNDKDNSDIDLSPESLEKDTILKLMVH